MTPMGLGVPGPDLGKEDMGLKASMTVFTVEAS
jgi:hypothetical protein